jgi:ABC-2 type transport system permease protein
LKKHRKTREESSANKVFLVIERDIRLFFQSKVMIIMRAIWFTSQIALFGLIASQMVTIPNYFRYYVAGLSVMTLYSAAIYIGFDIYEEAEHGVFEYLLSLPVSRRQLVLGRSIGGGVRAFIYVGPLVAISIYVLGSLNPVAFLISMFALFLFAFGMSGMSIALAVTIKSSDRFDILMGVLDALIVRLSTAMYPLAVLQASNPAYAWLATFNPLTYVTNLFRWGTAVTGLDENAALVAVFVVIAFFGFFTLLGITLYDRHIEGGGWQ